MSKCSLLHTHRVQQFAESPGITKDYQTELRAALNQKNSALSAALIKYNDSVDIRIVLWADAYLPVLNETIKDD